MLFSSIYFLLYFFPLFLFAYYLAPHKWKNVLAFAFSCFFYAWGAPRFFLLAILGLGLDFLLVRRMNKQEGKLRKYLLTTVIVLNVGTLLVYKYLDFFIENANVLLQSMSIGGIPLAEIALPIGISFITFQKLSYAIDVYRGTSEAQVQFVNYGLYILLFPQLIAGPIVRYQEVAEQIRDRRDQENIDNKLAGFFRFILGLAKKVLIANELGQFADNIFQTAPEQLGTGAVWLGVIAYSFQIYYDFAGYSDMAIGIARMIGFHFPENFRFPYVSQSITEFWRRWHITLGSWMRDYLYIPLGGNRVSVRRMYLNLWIVFLISGFWHGASWTFIIWGAWHGLFLVIDRLWWLKASSVLPKLFRILICYLIVLIGWVFFRADSLELAFGFLEKMFAWNDVPLQEALSNKFLFFLFLAAVASFAGAFKGWEKWVDQWYRQIPSIGQASWQTLCCSFDRLGLPG